MKKSILLFALLLINTAYLAAQTVKTDALEIGKTIERELKAGETQSFQVDLQRGKFLNAIINQQGIDVVVRVFAPDGSKVAEIDAPIGDQGSEVVAVEAKTDGTHRIEIAPFDKTKSGHFAMTLLSTAATVAYAPPLPPNLKRREDGFLKRAVVASGFAPSNYRVYLPIGFDATKKYPVVLYLHGNDGKGTYNESQRSGLGSVIELYNWKYPQLHRAYIAVFPQTENYWIGNAAEQAIAALDQTVAEFNADTNRLYLTGGSLGGYGSWYLAAKYPKKFAAVVPVCGGIAPPPNVPLAGLRLFMPAEIFALYSANDSYAAFAKAIGKTPVWIFHGAKDDIVSVTESRKMEAALKASGGNVKYTEYAEEGHFIADRVYTDAEFWKWLTAQKLAP